MIQFYETSLPVAATMRGSPQTRAVASESVIACHPEQGKLSAKGTISAAEGPVVELRPDKAGPSTRARIVAADPPAWSG
jgi:hypothetical protein